MQKIILYCLVVAAILAGCSSEEMEAYANHTHKSRSIASSNQTKIFLIGDSTVHNHDLPDGNGGYLEFGWGDCLGAYMQNPNNLFNEARSGASSKSYKVVHPKRHDWRETKALIAKTDISEGAYLLIQFGHNDAGSDRASVHTEPGSYRSFYENLKTYVDEARAMGVTPVLITPVQRQYKGVYHIPAYVDTIKTLAQEEGVLLLDLAQRSYLAFDKYRSSEEIHRKFGYDDHTHFNPDGAKRVAGWVKELACASGDDALCAVFGDSLQKSDIFVLTQQGDFSAYSHFSFFIDADDNPDTGYSRGKVKGADFLVQKNGLYHYPEGAKGWKWEKVSGDLTVVHSGSRIYSKIPAGMLYNSTTISYNAMASSSDWKRNRIYARKRTDLGKEKQDGVYIGAKDVASTPLQKGTLFVSVDGDGELCSQRKPCKIDTAFSKLKAGDVLFLRGGVYKIDKTLRLSHSGEKEKPIIIESYPGEWAIVDGGRKSAQSVAERWSDRINGILLDSQKAYVYIRRLESRYMGGSGISIQGSHNIVEGCIVHHNFSAGIGVYGGEWHEDSPDFVLPYKRGYNIIRNNIVYANSDVGLHASSGDGGNADGIWIGSGRFNRVEHNSVYGNSDDGIDTWRSNDTYVGYNRVFKNGLAQGDGNGIKAGGNLNKNAGNGQRAVVEHNLVYDNRANGVDYNAGRFDIFRYNTAYRNGGLGFRAQETTVMYNIAVENAIAQKRSFGKENSWNKNFDIAFISTDPDSEDFLRTTRDLGIGAYTTKDHK